MRRLFVVGGAVLMFVGAMTSAAGARADGESVAEAEDAGASAKAADKHDPDNIRGISRFMETIVEGNTRYMSRDYEAAAEAYRQASRLQPKHALGYYHQAMAELARARLPKAEELLRQAESMTDTRDPSLRAKVLFLLADVLERQRKWAAAKQTWGNYLEWTKTQMNGGGSPKSAAARMDLLETRRKQDETWKGVRERMAADKQFVPVAATSSDETAGKRRKKR